MSFLLQPGATVVGSGKTFTACYPDHPHEFHAVIVLGECGGEVSGFSDGHPIISGTWTANPAAIDFKVLHNCSVLYNYSFAAGKQDSGAINGAEFSMDGTWVLAAEARSYYRKPEDPDNHGTIAAVFHEEEDKAICADGGDAATKGTDNTGNNACNVEMKKTIHVPCSACGSDDAKLTFFEMSIPHFGLTELVAFSCADCGYKHNKMHTAVGQKPGPRCAVYIISVFFFLSFSSFAFCGHH